MGRPMSKDTTYIFDVDGTLTRPRSRIEPDFEAFFKTFVTNNKTYLISGSDIGKIREQLPEDILWGCRGVFGCSGAEFWQNGILQYQIDHEFPDAMVSEFQAFIDDSPYRERHGNHIEMRIGMINISVVGRNASQEQRKHYFNWDKIAKERADFVTEFNNFSRPYEASAGGEISIDIVPQGHNKSMVMPEILKREPDNCLVFFGDKLAPGGNDAPLGNALIKAGKPHEAIPVKNFQNTWDELKERA